MTPRDPSNPHSYKVRRAKVGGYRDYFDAEQVAQIDALVSATLSPVFGYGEAAAESPPTVAASSAAGAAGA